MPSLLYLGVYSHHDKVDRLANDASGQVNAQSMNHELAVTTWQRVSAYNEHSVKDLVQTIKETLIILKMLVPLSATSVIFLMPRGSCSLSLKE